MTYYFKVMLKIALDSLVGENNWAAYCINLKRCSERRESFTKWASEVGLPFEFFDATDKRDLTEEDIKKYGVNVSRQISVGATACRLSHLALYDKLLKETTYKYLFILEDDAGFKGNNTLEQLLEFINTVKQHKIRWAALQFGYHTSSTVQYKLLNIRASPLIYLYEYADQAHAILWTRDALKEIVNLCSQERHRQKPIDAVINVYQRSKKGITVGPEKSLISQVDSISYIAQD